MPSSSAPNRTNSISSAFADASRDSFPYETIEFNGHVQLLDDEGRVGLFSRRQKIRFLNDDVSTFVDRVWGEGVILAGYYARRMRLLEAFRVRNGYALMLRLPRPFQKGETFEIATERRIIGGFLSESAYWDSTMAAPTELLTLRVSAAAGRTFSHAEVVAPRAGLLDAKERRRSIDLQVRRPTPNIPYSLTWLWK